MITKVVFAAPDHTVDHVRELMASHKIHALPVVGKNKKIMGIVTTADVARRVEDSSPVHHVMSDNVVTIGATESVGKAARLMRKHRINHLAVTDGNKTVGIVSSYDLLRLFEVISKWRFDVSARHRCSLPLAARNIDGQIFDAGCRKAHFL